MNLLPVPYKPLEVTVLPNPFSMRREVRAVPAGLTIRQVVQSVVGSAGHAVVLRGDEPVPEARWNEPLLPSDHLIVRAVPRGGGGGGGGKNPLRIILTIVVMVVAPILGPLIGGWLGAQMGLGLLTTTGAAVFTGLTMAVGMLVVNAIAPPPKPGSLSMRASGLPAIAGIQQAAGSRSAIEQSPSLSGGRNQSNRYGPVPRVLGTHKIIPPYGASPYTEIAGNDQYLRMLFILGYGPLQVSDLKIGETPIDDFAGVEYEIRQGFESDEALTLYSNDVDEEALSVLLSSADGYSQRTTAQSTDEISIDITFPNGLIEFVENRSENQTSYVNQETGQIITEGELLDPELPRTVVVEWGYSPAGQDNWTTFQITTTAKTGKTLRVNRRVKVDNGQYDVRVKRITADTNSSLISDKVYWSALRSIHYRDPVNLSGIAKVAVRIKASDQLQGVVDTFSCVCTSLVDDYDSDTGQWVAQQSTSNPASLYKEVLQGSANKRALSDSEVALDNLAEWHQFCEENGFTYNGVIDYRTSVEEILSEIAAAGRARPAMVDGKYGAVWDREQTVPVQHFSPRNSWGFSAKKHFLDLPHAFRVRFPNAEKDWREDERIVYDDGYDETNATKFEQLELPGITDPDLAWKHGRYHIACARLRPEEYSFFCDVENLVCTRGDLIRVTHDVPMWGLGWARVKEVQDGGTYVTGVTLDNKVTMEADNIRWLHSSCQPGHPTGEHLFRSV